MTMMMILVMKTQRRLIEFNESKKGTEEEKDRKRGLRKAQKKRRIYRRFTCGKFNNNYS